MTKDLINEYGILNGAKCFVKDRTQNYLLFQLVFRYFKTPTDDDIVMALKSNIFLPESIKFPPTSDNSLHQNWIILIILNFKNNLMEVS